MLLIVAPVELVAVDQPEEDLSLLEVVGQIRGQNRLFKQNDDARVFFRREIGQNLVALTVEDHDALIEVMVLHGGG